jgi:hypothetical protein
MQELPATIEIVPTVLPVIVPVRPSPRSRAMRQTI